MKRLILASTSPRRHDLMTVAGLPFEVARPDIDETPLPDESPTDYVLRLSEAKARAVTEPGEMIILSADTTVADGDQILGKPEDPTMAEVMLRQLRGRVHLVHTGVTALDTTTGHSISCLITSQVQMRPLSDDEVAAYVASGDPLGKAGSYAIQNRQFHPVERLSGCYTNVVGLPLCAVYALLSEFEIDFPVPVNCSPLKLPCLYIQLIG